MERTIIEYEIRKYNPHQIYYYDSRVIKWDNKNPILSVAQMKELTDDEIKELYINLNIGYLVHQFGIEKCEKIFIEFIERRS